VRACCLGAGCFASSSTSAEAGRLLSRPRAARQVVRWSHWLLGHAAAWQRDDMRLRDLLPRVATLPLGSGAAPAARPRLSLVLAPHACHAAPQALRAARGGRLLLRTRRGRSCCRTPRIGAGLEKAYPYPYAAAPLPGQATGGRAGAAASAGALAGNPFGVDRRAIAADLGMVGGVCPNSMDAVSDRDYVCEARARRDPARVLSNMFGPCRCLPRALRCAALDLCVS